jgi:hypothetical protein
MEHRLVKEEADLEEVRDSLKGSITRITERSF